MALLALTISDDVIGFAEATFRKDYVNGCRTSPVLFLEGIFVHQDHRRKGIARKLCETVAAMGKEAGCQEFASDVSLENLASQAVHRALGFKETERVVYFHRDL